MNPKSKSTSDVKIPGISQGMSWSFYNIWNETLDNHTERELKVRSNIWASEIGKPMIDRWLKMRAVKPTNPFTARALRKFEAGNIWEWIVGMVLERAGILQESEKWVSHKYPGLLEVTGRLDYLAGGKPDWDKVAWDVQSGEIPDFIKDAAKGVLEQLRTAYPDGMKEIVFEIKSASSFVFERLLKFEKPQEQHEFQNFHYLKATEHDEGHIVYVNKDDARLLEFMVTNPGPIEEGYKKDIEEITRWLESGKQPPKEEEITYEEKTLRFTANWKVQYSSYLTMVYGYKDQSAFEDAFKPRVAQWNRVFKRYYTGAKITDKNKDVRKDIEKVFPNFDEIVDKAVITHAKLEAEKSKENIKKEEK